MYVVLFVMGREVCFYNLGQRKFTLGLVLHLQHGNQWKNRVLAMTERYAIDMNLPSLMEECAICLYSR